MTLSLSILPDNIVIQKKNKKNYILECINYNLSIYNMEIVNESFYSNITKDMFENTIVLIYDLKMNLIKILDFTEKKIKKFNYIIEKNKIDIFFTV